MLISVNLMMPFFQLNVKQMLCAPYVPITKELLNDYNELECSSIHTSWSLTFNVSFKTKGS